MSSGCCELSLRRLRLFAYIGFVAAVAQFIIMVMQYRHASSPTLLACVVFSGGFMLCYLVYVIRANRLNPASAKYDKYFLLGHILIATWYFWIALLTYVYHNVGLNVSDVLDPHSPYYMKSSTLSTLASFFALTVLVHAAEIYTIWFHSRMIKQGTLVFEGDTPRLVVTLTTLMDIVFLGYTGWSYTFQRDYGTIVLLILGILSFLLQMKHTLFLWRKQAPFTTDQHVKSQYLAVQHMLISSTIFLVNLLLVLVHQVGKTFTDIVDDDNGDGQGRFLVVSIVAYIFILFTSIFLVNAHTTLETPEHSHDFDGEHFSGSITDWSGYSAVPVPLHDTYMAGPVPLDP